MKSSHTRILIISCLTMWRCYPCLLSHLQVYLINWQRAGGIEQLIHIHYNIATSLSCCQPHPHSAPVMTIISVTGCIASDLCTVLLIANSFKIVGPLAGNPPYAHVLRCNIFGCAKFAWETVEKAEPASLDPVKTCILDDTPPGCTRQSCSDYIFDPMGIESNVGFSVAQLQPARSVASWHSVNVLPAPRWHATGEGLARGRP